MSISLSGFVGPACSQECEEEEGGGRRMGRYLPNCWRFICKARRMRTWRCMSCSVAFGLEVSRGQAFHPVPM
eukprot:2749541-Pyramimonas_sp.AAC.1